MKKLNLTILLASLIFWSANTLAGKICNATANTKKNGYGIGSKPTASEAKKQAMTSCEFTNPKDTCTITSVLCQEQMVKVVDGLVWIDGLRYEENSEIPFTGKKLTRYDNGEKYTEINYKAGKQEGIYTYWYDNGQKKEEGKYKSNKQEGLSTKWYKNGKKKEEVNYRAGKKEGVYTHWYDTGKKKYEGKYKAGKKVGFHYQWDKNGTLFYNKDHR